MGLKYTDNVDSFGAGVVLHVLLFGRVPFQGSDICSTLRKTMRCKLNLDVARGCGALSTNCKQFLLHLLCKSPYDRLSSRAALAHAWLQPKGLAEDQDHCISNASQCESNQGPGTDDSITSFMVHRSRGAAAWVSHVSSQQDRSEGSSVKGSCSSPEASPADDPCLEELPHRFVPFRPLFKRHEKPFVRRMSGPGSQGPGKLSFDAQQSECETTATISTDEGDCASKESEDLLDCRTHSNQSDGDGKRMKPSSLADNLIPSRPSSRPFVAQPLGAVPSSRFRRFVNRFGQRDASVCKTN